MYGQYRETAPKPTPAKAATVTADADALRPPGRRSVV